MFFHFIADFFRVAFLTGFQNRNMIVVLVCQNLFFFVYQFVPCQQISIVQFFPRFGKSRKSGHQHQLLMKAVVVFKNALELFCWNFSHSFQNLFHFLYRFSWYFPVQEPHADGLIVGTKQIYFIGIPERKCPHGTSHISGILYDSFVFQLAQCLPDRPPAGLEFVCQFHFHDPLPRAYLMIHDLGPDCIHYTFS